VWQFTVSANSSNTRLRDGDKIWLSIAMFNLADRDFYTPHAVPEI